MPSMSPAISCCKIARVMHAISVSLKRDDLEVLFHGYSTAFFTLKRHTTEHHHAPDLPTAERT